MSTESSGPPPTFSVASGDRLTTAPAPAGVLTTPVESRSVDLSVVVVNRNTRSLLAELLSSLESLPDPIAFEVILVDNGSTDGSVEMAASRSTPPRIIRNPDNTGYARANNQGLAVARGRYLLLLNSDTRVLPGTLEGLVGWMDAHPRAGACGPRLRTPDGEIQRTCSSFATPWRSFCDLSGLGGLFPRSRLFGNLNRRFGHDATQAVDWLIGAALLVRREVVEQVGVLDERFRIYSNDSDWCHRIRAAGWEVWYVHPWEIIHHGGATIAIEGRDGALQREMMRNQIAYQHKYHGRTGAAWLRACMVAGFGLRAGRLAVLQALRPRPERAALRREFSRMAAMALRGGA